MVWAGLLPLTSTDGMETHLQLLPCASGFSAVDEWEAWHPQLHPLPLLGKSLS